MIYSFIAWSIKPKAQQSTPSRRSALSGGSCFSALQFQGRDTGLAGQHSHEQQHNHGHGELRPRVTRKRTLESEELRRGGRAGRGGGGGDAAREKNSQIRSVGKHQYGDPHFDRERVDGHIDTEAAVTNDGLPESAGKDEEDGHKDEGRQPLRNGGHGFHACGRIYALQRRTDGERHEQRRADPDRHAQQVNPEKNGKKSHRFASQTARQPVADYSIT